MRGERSNFPEISNFPYLQVYISKTINRIETKLSPWCSTFNSEQNGILVCYLDQILVMYSIPEENNVTLTGKTPEGKLGESP